MRGKIAVLSLAATVLAACAPGDAIVDTWRPPTASSTASAASAPSADLDRLRDLIVGTWLRTEAPSEVWERYLIDGTSQTLDFSGHVLGSRRWELVSVTVSDGTAVAGVQTQGDPRTRMLIGAIDWEAMTLSIPNRGTSYHYNRVGASPFRGWFSGHWRGLTIRADGTGTGYYTKLCDESGVTCVNDVEYAFVLLDEAVLPGPAVGGRGIVTAERRITGARPASARSLLKPGALRIDLETDIISTAPSFSDAAFCGARARPSACGA